MKVSFFDKRVLRFYCGALALISAIMSIAFLFVEIDTEYKPIIGSIVLFFFVFLYIGIWVYSNVRQSIQLKINTSDVEVKFGDIFSEHADFKVIPFNEYFDTLVDDKVIAESSLNGQYIKKFFTDKVGELDRIISTDDHLPEAVIFENTNRPVGKKTVYKLGTICIVKDYLLTALTHFDADNRAYLDIKDYISGLLNFWNEVDRTYAGKTVALPVLGSGITRFKGYGNISDQELLELIIWTFKVSPVKFAHPSKMKIVVHKDKSDKINLLKLKDLETN